eukprot:CAMPEP_0202964858 /NCGR_PEP_ID=MMETSP1396-20130829/8963_1 /ASSEMBLY_ACC=CAM_ASM_000872 /TAXON_ID= /ORGANISM="Pseudokeronopsis sp., Strain Brazil" /LENGTH=162 /DNA_ID=CAMNT_0049687297 /DNA_START=87 /DNA_END=575 /DNA_ORIENTATION=-
MELALLTGVKIILTLYDEAESRLIQYKSDSLEAIQDIRKQTIQVEEMYMNEDYFKTFCKDDDKDEEEEEEKFTKQTKGRKDDGKKVSKTDSGHSNKEPPQVQVQDKKRSRPDGPSTIADERSSKKQRKDDEKNERNNRISALDALLLMDAPEEENAGQDKDD